MRSSRKAFRAVNVCGLRVNGADPEARPTLAVCKWRARQVCLGSAAALRISFISLEGAQGAPLFSARHFAACATVVLFVHAFAASIGVAQAQAAGGCGQAVEISMFSSPFAPAKGVPLRVVFTSEQPIEGELSLVAPDGKVAAKSQERHGGPPYFWFVEVASPAVGTWRATLARVGAPAECGAITREVAVRRSQSSPPSGSKGVWPLRENWNRATENLYSAWIEKLFDAPVDVSLSWPALQDVLRDRSRNFLFNHLGLREDEKGLLIRPDCADLPYFLRAYFAFKLGLPFGYSKCTRGAGGQARSAPSGGMSSTKNLPPCSRMKPPHPAACSGSSAKKPPPWR